MNVLFCQNIEVVIFDFMQKHIILTPIYKQRGQDFSENVLAPSLYSMFVLQTTAFIPGIILAPIGDFEQNLTNFFFRDTFDFGGHSLFSFHINSQAFKQAFK